MKKYIMHTGNSLMKVQDTCYELQFFLKRQLDLIGKLIRNSENKNLEKILVSEKNFQIFKYP